MQELPVTPKNGKASNFGDLREPGKTKPPSTTDNLPAAAPWELHSSTQIPH